FMRLFLSTMIPIAIYVIIESVFEFKTAIILTVIYGFIEFFYFYHKDKKVDKLILVSVVLIVVTGFISYYFDNPSFIKLKPAVLQFFAVAFLMYFVITKKSIFDIMKDRLPQKQQTLSKDQSEFLQKITKHTTIMLFLHSFLIIYTAFYCSSAIWAFTSGVMPYILMVLLMFFEIIYKRVKNS
ncbi:septation protein IspZ, partial [bacterium]|nr:septation protein IspZ [bacterium]